ncbi:MAG: hypothetical protein EOO04_13335 [Chitinophagaceae bacterium]|nr:MAG: hypothetical protein EOO04_13335 [Chitinophagaceae bacterium]
MATSLHFALILHIISGSIALITGFLSMLNRKGSKPHRLTGKLFFAGMTGVFLTTIFIAWFKNLPFLFMVGFFSYYLACSGYRALKLKKLHAGQPAAPIDWTVSIIGIVSGAALIGFSVTWFATRGGWGLVPLSFGIFCLVGGITDMRNYVRSPLNKNHWVITHGGRMGGSFAATLTAFTVVNFSLGAYTWVLWLLPGVLTGIWINRLIRGFMKKPVLKTEMLENTGIQQQRAFPDGV